MDLSRFPRMRLGHLPTPLEPAPRLTAALGGPRIWIKRDDCTGLATGGNKTRKLEFLLGEAHARGADHVITFGAVQSNHARQTAAACARLGLGCDLILTRRVAWHGAGYERAGNVLIDRLCGAELHLIDAGDVDATLAAIRERLRAAGSKAYVIPAGGSNPTGALGYVAAAAELLAETAREGFTIDAVVHASSSGGTQAGLLAGFAIEHAATRVIGVNVYERDHDAIVHHVADLARGTLEHLGHHDLAPATPELMHDQIGDDYGLPTPAMVEAVTLAARCEGLILDPVYSGKAMVGSVAACRGGRLHDARNVVFLHTGGNAALGVYARAFADSTPDAKG